MKITKWFLIILVLCNVFTPPGLMAENHALIVGVGNYQIPEARLPGIDKDVRMMQEVALEMDFKANQIKLLLDADATLAGIKAAINGWLVRGVTSQDRVLFYFSGHGSSIADQNGDEEDKVDEVLLPYDTAMDNNTISGTLVDDEFGLLLKKIPAGEVYVFIDACHSGTATKGIDLMRQEYPKFFKYRGMPQESAKGSFGVQETADNNNYIGLSACRDNQTATATKAGSLFTCGVYRTIKAASSKIRTLTMDDLKGKTTEYIRKNASSSDKIYHPQINGNNRLAKKNLFIGPAPPSGGIWGELEKMADHADFKLGVQSNKNQFKIGELLEITCDIQEDGYLNVLNVGPNDTRATVLFPNRFNPDNHVRAGNRVSIPGGRFELPAQAPSGDNLVIVFHTREPINTYQEGDGKGGDLLKLLSTKSQRSLDKALRSFGVKANKNRVGAGKLILKVLN